MKILIAAFEPFGGEEINPAWEAVSRLPEAIGGAAIIRVQVPTVFHKALDVLNDALDREHPDVTIGVGQAGGYTGLAIERIAINVDDARIEDNAGNLPVDAPIMPDGPAAYFSTLPIKEIVAAIREGGLPASVSNSAGTFVCNHLMYGLLYAADHRFPAMRAGFIHVPYLPVQVVEKRNQPSMALGDIVRGLTLAVEAVVAKRDSEEASKREGD